MNCANCGNLLPPGARVCPNCGTPVPTTIPASSPNIPPSEQTGYGNFGSFQKAGPTIPNSPVNQDKTVRQNPPPAPQDSSSTGYGIPAMPQEQFQFPDQPPFAAEQSNQPYQSYQQPLQSSSPQRPFASSMPPQQPLFPGATPQQVFPGNPSPHFSDTTQQDIPASNPPSFPGTPPQQPPFVGQAEQYGQPGQQWQPGQRGQFGQAAQPGQQWQPGQPAPLNQNRQPVSPAPRRRSTGLIIALIAAIILIIFGSSLVYYLGVARPAQLHAQATATVVTNLTSQAQGTVAANTHATGTAQAQANATTTAVAVATAQVQATMTAYVSMYTQATSGTPALNDQLSQNDSNDWNIYSDNGGACTFTGGALHTTGIGGFCNARSTNFGNFAYQADMMILKGTSSSSAGGLMFRLDNSTLKFYIFGIGADGSYSLALLQIASGSKSTFKNLTSGFSSAIHTGLHQQNRLGVLARGSNFYLYANNQFITRFNDSSSAAGSIGVFGLDNNGALDIAFVNAEVWQA